MSDAVIIREVGLRDGLQSVAAVMSTEDKLEWTRRTLAAGIHEIELCSFVPKKLFPQFHDSLELVTAAQTLPDIVLSVLVPNVIGANNAFATGAHKINVVVSISEAHNRANIRRSTQESFEGFRQIVQARDERVRAGQRRKDIILALATSFGCSIAGPIDPADVIRYAERGAEAGADEIVLADTVGYASPRQVTELFRQLEAVVDSVPLSAHFHNTRGLGCANALAAYDSGVRRFDAALAGLGGCPAAPGATGNVVTEDLAFMFEAMGVETGIDVEVLIDARRILTRGLPGVALQGELAKAGLPKKFHS